jgi:membrane associated rhomboid family serine protease
MNYYRPNSFRILPEVVKNLLIINGIFFLATIVFANRLHIDLVDILGLHYFGAEKFKPYQIITYMFMHGGFTHILFNMFALWMFGSAMENVWGQKRFLTYYLVTGIGASLLQYIVIYIELKPTLDVLNSYMLSPTIDEFNRMLNDGDLKILNETMRYQWSNFTDSYQAAMISNPESVLGLTTEYVSSYKMALLDLPVMVGASGAVFGLLLAYGMTFPNNVIYLYFAIPIKAKYFVILYGLLELYMGFSNNSSNVAHFAHIGGMLFGFFLIKFWNKNQYRRF